MTPQETLTKLISFPTLSRDHRTNLEALSWIKQQLQSLPLIIKEHSYDGFPALVATTQPTTSPTIWLQGHLDVVPAPKDAFTAYKKDGRLYGRGSFDMKYAIACYIVLAQQLGASLTNYNFGIMITTDEEIGGFKGVKALLEEGYSAQAVVLPDGGHDWHYVSAARAIWHIRSTATGDANHGSKPWLGRNAITTLTDFLNDVRGLFPSEPCGVPDHFHDTVNVGIIRGGKAVNQIPSEAEADLDIRFLVEHKHQLKQALQELLDKKYPGIITLTTLAEGAGYKVDQSNPFFKIFSETATQITKRPAQFDITYGSSDARYFAEHGIGPIVLRPIGGGDHSEHEWIDLASLEQFYSILREFILNTAI